MKHFYIFNRSSLIAILFFSYNLLMAQGPITPTEGFIGRTEIAVVWENSYLKTGSETEFSFNSLSLKENYESFSNFYQRLNLSEKKKVLGNFGNKIINGASGDFNGDGVDEYAVVSHGDNNTLNISIPLFASNLIIDTIFTQNFAEPVSSNEDMYKGNFLVEAGDLNADGKQEIVLAYIKNEVDVNILIYVVEEDSNIELKQSILNETLEPSDKAEKFAIELANLNGGQDDELILAFYSDTPGTGVYVKLFSFANNNNLTPQSHARTLIDDVLVPEREVDGIDLLFDITTGDYDGDNETEIVFGFTNIYEPGELRIFPLEYSNNPGTSINDPLERIEFDPTDFLYVELNWNGVFFNLESGDINNDGRDDILAGGTSVHILYTEENNGLKFKSKDIDYIWGQGFKYLDVADIDNNKDNGMEVIIAKDISSDLNVEIFTSSTDFNLSILARKNFNTYSKGLNSYLLVTGDFDGDIFKIGPGKKYIKTDIVQPLVILNAPPTHFDMFGDDLFDVNNCHDGFGCESYATYSSTTSSDISVSTSN